jgi:hypothetical protein
MSFSVYRQLEIRWIDLEPTRGAESENTASPPWERGLQGAELGSAHSPSASSRAQGTQKKRP